MSSEQVIKATVWIEGDASMGRYYVPSPAIGPGQLNSVFNRRSTGKNNRRAPAIIVDADHPPLRASATPERGVVVKVEAVSILTRP